MIHGQLIIEQLIIRLVVPAWFSIPLTRSVHVLPAKQTRIRTEHVHRFLTQLVKVAC